jgi:hypothetical protein
MHRTFIVCLFLAATAVDATQAQDTTWQQVLGGWVDDVYYENLFLGGAYWTRISLADIDGDGDLDMFYGGGTTGSLTYFENVGNYQEPDFELRYEEFPGLKHPSIHGETADADFADMDTDGDLDAAFAAEIDFGGFLYWNDGTIESADFVFRAPYGPADGQSNVTLIDIDADGDYDYFSGQGYRTFQMYFAENIGTAEEPIFETRSHHYQDLDFGIPFNFDFGDIDEDGDFDLLVCKHGGNVGYYENTGTPEDAEFVLVTDDFLPDRDTTDWMETPELADIDGDGDLDLFLAGAFAHLYYFENLGVEADPQFVERSDTSYFYVFPFTGGSLISNSVDIDGDGDEDFDPGRSLLLNESTWGETRYSRYDNVMPFMHGWAADMDNDGDYDYLTPAFGNFIGYFENIGDSSWPFWDSMRQLFPPDGRLEDVWGVATGDLDNDGDQDLLVGDAGVSNGLAYYRNDGTPEAYEFNFVQQNYPPGLGHLVIMGIALGDIDNDDDLDLLLSDMNILEGNDPPVRLVFYRNDGTPEAPSWTFVTDDFQSIIHDHRNGNVAVCLSDVDRDGDKDLLLSVNLGLQLFLNPLIVTAVEEDHDNNLPALPIISGLACYPNPFNSTAIITLEIGEPSDIDLSVYNLLGQRVESILKNRLEEGAHRIDWRPDNLAAGVYFLRASAGKNSTSIKILYLK